MQTKTLDKSIRVILADDHTLVRAGIRALLEKFPRVEVIAEAEDGRAVLELVRQHRPDIVLMDIGMPGLNGLETAERLSKESPETRVIILSMHRNEEYVRRAISAGASGYLSKRAAASEIAFALSNVANGESYFSRDLPARTREKSLLDGVAVEKSPLEQLTARQREVLQLIAEGRNTKQIADALGVSPKTVEYHRIKLMDALNLHDIPGLVRFALRAGLVAHEMEPLVNGIDR
jgi:DNA-binding NarL/FixJ family response regulator